MKGDGLFGEWEATYFSHLRGFAQSDTAHRVIERNDRMNATEYIDAISRDLQDLITTLDNDPNTSASVKGKAKYIQEIINLYYNSMFDEYKKQLQIPDAPPYKIGDEGYQGRVTCKDINPCETCSFKEVYRNELPCCNCTNWSEYTLYGVKTEWQKSVRYI